MPALAVTEHGNMFSSVIFHDHARAARASSRSSAARCTSRPGSRRAKSGHARARRRTTSCCSPRTHEGYHNLIKLVSAGYTEGFYYKPRIDKELLAQHARGLIGLSSCLKGEVAERAAQRPGAPGARGGGGATATSSAPATSSSRCSDQGIEDQRIVNRGLLPIARDLDLPLVCTNDVHYLTRERLPAARHPAVHRHRRRPSTTRSACGTTATSSS